MALVNALMAVELLLHSIFCLGWRNFLGCPLLAATIFMANYSSNLYPFIQQGKEVGILYRLKEKACCDCDNIDAAIWELTRLFTLSDKSAGDCVPSASNAGA